MFFELGSALAQRPSARLKRLCPFTIFTNCFGNKVRDSGQSLVPEPPHRIIFVMFFLFLCEILRHYSKIWQIDLNLFLFFALFCYAFALCFASADLGCRGVFSLGILEFLEIASVALLPRNDGIFGILEFPRYINVKSP